ncbi:hypothetical protein Pth03_81810 [Planotetraspora thailandica]|uniref:Uncharacterized protein n=1 Tax=Planotetraspora thailandica TaxID=487172 RepID=A0A8J4DGQ0_9ACTN|nr:hypothetical protein Pth03_81810 [Planotetraspora thailandica]
MERRREVNATETPVTCRQAGASGMTGKVEALLRKSGGRPPLGMAPTIAEAVLRYKSGYRQGEDR